MEELSALPGQERGLQVTGRCFNLEKSPPTFRHPDMAILLQHRDEETVYGVKTQRLDLNVPPGSALLPPGPTQELPCSWS